MCPDHTKRVDVVHDMPCYCLRDSDAVEDPREQFDRKRDRVRHDLSHRGSSCDTAQWHRLWR